MRIKLTRTLFLFTLLAFYHSSLKAQTNRPYLERIISVEFSDERIELALKQIAEAGGFTFSYNPSVLETDRIISHQFHKRTVREILDEIFQGSVEYKVRGKHLILTKAKHTSKNDDEKVLSGYVIDESTGEKLKNVSVYDPVTLTSAVTDSYGYFEIKLDKQTSQDIRLAIKKQDYTDTVVVVPSRSGRLLNIPIEFDKEKFKVAADSVTQIIKQFWNNKVLYPAKPNLLNIDDTLYRTVQFSVVPFIGTNHRLSGNVVNDFSFNLFGGYSRSVKMLEFGGLFNINRSDARWIQIAGVFNTNGGNVKGFQMGGLFNVNNGEVMGGQISGLANANWNGISYFSLTGGLNLTRGESRGAHIAGISNLTMGNQDGPHIAGIFNLATANSHGTQFAGVFNLTAKNFRGGQVAGVFNLTGKNVTGSQMAGVFNFTGKKISGNQTSGVLNYASHVKGNQLALLNIADSVEGISIGLLSFALSGYHKIEISADEIFYTNLAFRSGVRKFYNIFTAGAKPDTFEKNQTYWTFGYGLGTARKLSRWLFLNFDLYANQIMQDQNIKRLNLLNKLYVGFDVQFTRHLSLTFGGTLNGHLTKTTGTDYQPLFTEYNPRIFYHTTLNRDVDLKSWAGGKIGLRFF